MLIFIVHQKKLVIEIDGPQHFVKESREYDEIRTSFFEGLEIRVIRFTNLEVSTETQRVVKKIKSVLTTP